MSDKPPPAAVEARFDRDLALRGIQPAVAAALDPHRIPPHRDGRAKAGPFVIRAEPLARIIQPVVEMAAGMEPCERRFG